MGADYFFEKSSDLRNMTQLLRDLTKSSGTSPSDRQKIGTKRC